MPLTKFNANVNVISALDDEPNDKGGLSAAQLKAKFDEAGIAIKSFVNNSLIPELENQNASASLGAKLSSGSPSTVQNALAAKVDKLDGYTLSKNDFSDFDKSNLNANSNARHTHANIAQLNLISEISQSLGNSSNKLPSEAAVYNAIRAAAETPHAASHSSSGSDRITPQSIGAEPLDSAIMRKNTTQVMTSFLQLNAAPQNPMHAANKSYVDSAVIKPNLLVNGDFQVWSNGSSFSTAGAETADLWTVHNPTASFLVSKNSSGGINITNNASGNLVLRYHDGQILHALAGKQTAVSAGVTALSGNVFIQVFHGSDTLAAFPISMPKGSAVLTFPQTVTLPLYIDIMLNNVSSISISYVKLELNTISSDHAQKPYIEELILCNAVKSLLL